MRKYLSALLIGLLTLYVASRDQSAIPSNDWRQVIEAPKDTCPDITGTYSIMDEASYLMLGGHYEKTPKNWDTLTISGNPQQELHISLYETNTGATNETPIKRVRGKDYDCKSGLFDTEWPYGVLPLNNLDENIPNDEQFEKSLSFAKNAMGELIIRINTHQWKTITTFCFDGCKSLPIPFTSQTRYKWSRWPVATIPTKPKPDDGTHPIQESTTVAEGSPEARARNALRKMTKPGVQLTSLKNTGSTWKATFHGDSRNLLELHEAAQSSGEILFFNIKIEPSTSTQKELRLEFGLPPTKEEQEAKRAAEKELLQKALLNEKADRALVKRLLPSFPTGMTMTASRHDAETFLVEVRHKNEEAFYELITRAIASGEFLSANIKTRKYVDNEGNQVVDILLVPKPQEQNSSQSNQ